MDLLLFVINVTNWSNHTILSDPDSCKNNNNLQGLLIICNWSNFAWFASHRTHGPAGLCWKVEECTVHNEDSGGRSDTRWDGLDSVVGTFYQNCQHMCWLITGWEEHTNGLKDYSKSADWKPCAIIRTQVYVCYEPEAEYLIPNKWDLTCYKVFKSYLTHS